MDTIDIVKRVSEAIGKCTKLQQEAASQARDASERAAAAKKAYEEAEAHSKAVQESCRADLTAIKARQSLLGRLIDAADEKEIEEALVPLELTNGPVSLVKSPTPPPAQASPKPAKKTSPLGGFKLSTASYANDPGYVEACSIIVPHGDAFAEIRCTECNTNIDPSRRTWMKGACGVQKHLARIHEIRLDVAQALDRSIHRTLTVEEVREILAGEVELEKVAKGAVVSRPVRGKRAAAAALPPVAGPSSQKKRKADSVVESSVAGESEEEEEEEGEMGERVNAHGVSDEDARKRMKRMLGSSADYANSIDYLIEES